MSKAQAEKKNGQPLLEVKDLKVHFPVRAGLFSQVVGHVKAVDGVSLTVEEGETLGLVGESGCGKTTAGRALLRLVEPTAGEVYFRGTDVRAQEGQPLIELRKQMQIIFQDPYSSLNPRKTVMDIVGEPIEVHGIATGQEKEDLVIEYCEASGLSADYVNRYPHEFSGGQRQRLGIARALALRPSFIVCDEPVSALDVSIQAQVVNLLIDLQKRYNLAYLFISHDLAVVKHISDRIAVMYLGRIVELAPKGELFRNPKHPYTKALLSAVPIPDPTKKAERIPLKGETPSPLNPPSGCPFHPRCPDARPECAKEEPPVKEVDDSHWYRCVV